MDDSSKGIYHATHDARSSCFFGVFHLGERPKQLIARQQGRPVSFNSSRRSKQSTTVEYAGRSFPAISNSNDPTILYASRLQTPLFSACNYHEL
jgi:hypothetical protein